MGDFPAIYMPLIWANMSYKPVRCFYEKQVFFLLELCFFPSFILQKGPQQKMKDNAWQSKTRTIKSQNKEAAHPA